MPVTCATDEIDLRYERRDLTLNVGQDLTVELEFRHLDTGLPFDLTGWTLIAGLNTIPGVAVVPSPLVVSVVGKDPVGGQATLYLPAGLPVGRWMWWLSMQTGALAPVHLVGGQLIVDAMSQFQSPNANDVVVVTFQGLIRVNVTASVATGGAGSDDLIVAHLMDPTPHPVYDEMPSLVLIFENVIV